jgi:hypothetical protein
VVKGPILLRDDPFLAEAVVQLILQQARRLHCQLLVIQPPASSAGMVDVLKSKYGFKTSVLEPEHTSTLILALTVGLEQVLAGMKRQTRQNVHRSEREGIQITYGTTADLRSFYDLYTLTGQRQDFEPYSWKYIQTMWENFAQRDEIGLVMASFEGQIVSAMLILCFGSTTYAYIMGWNGQHGDKRPNDALYWGAIQWADAHGSQYFDFGGVDIDGARAVLAGQELPASLHSRPDFLKYGFGGNIVIDPPALDYLPDPLIQVGYRSLLKIGGDRRKILATLAKVRQTLLKGEDT